MFLSFLLRPNSYKSSKSNHVVGNMLNACPWRVKFSVIHPAALKVDI
jgi:hypothetical protein